MDALVQIAGSFLILVPFLLVQFGRMKSTSRSYLGLNFAGSTVLAIAAATGHQWGFLLLEVVWAIASLTGLIRPGIIAEEHTSGPCS